MYELISIIGNFIAKHLLPKDCVDEDSDMAGALGLASMVLIFVIFIVLIQD